MSDAALADLRSALEEEKVSLRAQLAELGYGEGEGLDYDHNFADTSQVTAERGETEAVAAKLQAALDEVENALGKIGGGSYGTCEKCGEPIAPARLEAKPEARFCINCASKRP
jgi:RNA polymerase-binding transcription factor DksA